MANTENQTRKQIIDKQLLVAGWDITDCTQVIEEFDIKIEISDSVDEDITGPAVFDFKGSVFLKEMIEFGPGHESVSMSKYCKMVGKRIFELILNNPVLQKIKQGEVISERESINKIDLIESPFTIIHPKGIRGIFTPSEIDEILILIKELAA